MKNKVIVALDNKNLKQIVSLVKKTKPSIIFHLAPQTLILESYMKPHQTIDINLNGTLNVLEVVNNCNFI